MTKAEYKEKLEQADALLAELTDSRMMPGAVNGQVEDLRAELFSEMQALDEEEAALHV